MDGYLDNVMWCILVLRRMGGQTGAINTPSQHICVDVSVTVECPYEVQVGSSDACVGGVTVSDVL